MALASLVNSPYVCGAVHRASSWDSEGQKSIDLVVLAGIGGIMKMNVGRLAALTAVCSGAALAVAPASALATEACTENITGSGSSLQKVAQEQWIAGYTTSTVCTTPSHVSYTATSSGRALEQWGDVGAAFKLDKEHAPKENLDDFISSDVGPEGKESEASSQAGKMDEAGENSATEHNKLTTLPVAQSAVASIWHLPEGCATNVKVQKVKAAALEELWHKNAGTFESILKVKNVKTKACAVTPILLVRSSGSGTTAGFKRGLSNIAKAYGITADNNWGVATASEAESTTWPGTTTAGGKSGQEVIETLKKTKGSTAYADISDVHAAGITEISEPEFFVEVQNGISPETFASPANAAAGSAEKGEANCKEAAYGSPKAPTGGTTHSSDVDWSQAGQTETSATNDKTYPFCTLTFGIAWQHYKYANVASHYGTTGTAAATELANAVKGYLTYKLSTGGQALLNEHYYAALPSTILTLSKETVANIEP